MIDLHMHTSASDGKLSPKEMLQNCEKLGLKLISVTDHNNMNAYLELMKPEVRSLFSGRILTGCEVTSHYKGMQIEILGFGMDPVQAIPHLNANLLTPKQKKALELEDLIRIYRERGFPFDEAAVREHAKTCINMRAALWKELNRYPENRARYLEPASEEKGTIFTRKEAGNIKSPFFYDISAHWAAPKETVEMIHRLGGKAVIAHPGSYNSITYGAMEELIQTAKPDGLEAWYAAHSPAQRDYLLGLCKKYDLIYTGGSDAHGTPKGMPYTEDVFPEDRIVEWVQDLRMI